MEIDLIALRRFREVWEPVLAAIPVLLEVSAQQTHLDRQLELSRIKFGQAQAEIDAAYALADTKLEAVNAQMKAATDAQADVQSATAKLTADTAAETARAIVARGEALDAVNVQIAAAQSRLAGLDADYATQQAAAEKVLNDKIVDLNKVVSDLEKRQASAETTLNTLRNKLG